MKPGRVVRLAERPAGAGSLSAAAEMADRFVIKLERSRSQTTAHEYIKTKNETVLDFARDKEAALRSVKE